jgi:hypothetical protein
MEKAVMSKEAAEVGKTRGNSGMSGLLRRKLVLCLPENHV